MEKRHLSINNFQIYKLITENDNIQKIRGGGGCFKIATNYHCKFRIFKLKLKKYIDSNCKITKKLKNK